MRSRHSTVSPCSALAKPARALSQRTCVATLLTQCVCGVVHRYAWVSPESNRGYLAMGQERLDGGLPDLKETFEIGNEAETTYENRWPVGELPDFRAPPPLVHLASML